MSNIETRPLQMSDINCTHFNRLDGYGKKILWDIAFLREDGRFEFGIELDADTPLDESAKLIRKYVLDKAAEECFTAANIIPYGPRNPVEESHP